MINNMRKLLFVRDLQSGNTNSLINMSDKLDLFISNNTFYACPIIYSRIGKSRFRDSLKNNHIYCLGQPDGEYLESNL